MKSKPIYKSEQGRQDIIKGYKAYLSGLPVKYEEKYIDTGYGKTYVLEAGSRKKPAVLLLHGSTSNSSMWFGDIPHLAQEYNVFAVDVIGEPGSSEPKRHSLETDAYAMWLDEVVDGLGLKRVSFVGNSLGGWLALKFACVFPGKVRSMVLIATSGIVNVRPAFVLRSIYYAGKGEKGIRASYEYITGSKDIPDFIIEYSSTIMRGFNPRIGGLPVFTDEQVSRLSMPVLFMAGENDVTTHAAKAAKRMKRLVPNAQIDLINGCGHVIYDQAERIQEFLDGEGELN